MSPTHSLAHSRCCVDTSPVPCHSLPKRCFGTLCCKWYRRRYFECATSAQSEMVDIMTQDPSQLLSMPLPRALAVSSCWKRPACTCRDPCICVRIPLSVWRLALLFSAAHSIPITRLLRIRAWCIPTAHYLPHLHRGRCSANR